MSALLESISSLASGPFAANLAAALLHTLWQAMAIAVVLWLVLRTAATRNPELRYTLALAALALILVSGLFNFIIVDRTTGPFKSPAPGATAQDAAPEHLASPISPEASQPTAIARTDPTVEQAAFAPFSRTSVDWHTPVVLLWLAGVAFMLCRSVWMICGASRLRRGSQPLDDPQISAILQDLRGKMHITRHVVLAAIDNIASPAVVGLFRPTILLPVSMMTGMPPADISAILAHELAHIKRFDCLVNFCQMLIEAFLFFNPAVWWVSRQIRIEREACCDAASVSTTGQKLGYARLLYEWTAALSTAPTAPAAAAMLPFSKGDNGGVMLDRVQRIVVKGHRPRMRLSWYMTVAMIAAAAVLSLGLWHGTKAGVEFAGKIITPHERIEKMAEIQKTHGQTAYDHDASSNLTEDQKVTLSGIVRTWDGLPLPKNTYMALHAQRPGHGISAAIGIDTKDPGHGTFATRGSYGVIYISAHADGYSPCFIGPFELEPGDEKRDIEVIFQEAIHAEIRLVDADSGQPIEGVNLTGGHIFRPGGWHTTINTATDDQGRASIAFVEGVPVTLRAKADLYEHTQFEKVTLSAADPLVLKMRKALPTTGTVLSAATGQPVAGAQIRIQRKGDPQRMGYGRDQGEVLATTDADGRFTITCLQSPSKYILAIKADGYAYAFPEVGPGDIDVIVQLPNQIVIKGQVAGPLENLPTHKGQTAVDYTCGHELDHSSHWSSTQYAPITETDDGVFFEIDDVWGNRINIGPGRFRQRLDLDKDKVPQLFVLDLREKTTPDGAPYTRRTVVLNFNVPKDAPPVRGNVRIASFDHDKGYSYGKLVDVVENQAQTEIVAPGTFSYQLADTIGYWFKAQHGIKVDSGSEPYVLTVDAVPAGTIFGEVFDHDGRPVGNTLVSVYTVEKSPLLGDVHFDGVEGKNSTSEAERRTRFSIQPLPLGGKYRVVPHQGYMYLVSETITLTEEQPIRRLDLTFPKGVTLTGKFLHPDGSPAPGIEYDLAFIADKGGSFGRSGRFTDAAGTFTCENINPNPQGKYVLRIKSTKTWRPQSIDISDFEEELTVRLVPGAVVQGRIIDEETGWPIPGVEISAYYYDQHGGNSEHPGAESKTDKDGRFRFSTLEKGRNYRLMTSDCRIVEPIAPEITGGQSEAITLRVRLYGWSKLKPQKPE